MKNALKKDFKKENIVFRVSIDKKVIRSTEKYVILEAEIWRHSNTRDTRNINVKLGMDLFLDLLSVKMKNKEKYIMFDFATSIVSNLEYLVKETKDNKNLVSLHSGILCGFDEQYVSHTLIEIE